MVDYVACGETTGPQATRLTDGVPAPPEPRSARSVGTDAGKGNLVGIEPFLTTRDHASPQAYRDKLDAYLRDAKRRGWLNEKTIVVFPEHVGLWLMAVNEADDVFATATNRDGMMKVAKRRWRSFPTSVVSAYLGGTRDSIAAAILKVKAAEMASAYDNTFSEMARLYGVTIVAGSIPLPGAWVSDRGLEVDTRQPIYNTSVVYHRDGKPDRKLVYKVNPTSSEGFVAGARSQDLPVFETPAGRLGVLVCADSWYPETYEALREKGVELIAVPAYLDRDGALDEMWKGYDGAPKPADITDAVYRAEVGQITEGEAWLRHAMAGRLATSGAKVGLTVYNRSRVWERGSDGASIVNRANADAVVAEHVAPGTGAAVNVWIE